MDRKTIIVLVACVLLMIGWPVLVQQIFPPRPVPPELLEAQRATNSTGSQTSHLTSNAPAANGQSGAGNAIHTPPAAETAKSFVARTDVPERLLVVSNENARYIFTSRGGGLKEVQLLHYPETVSTVRKSQQTNQELASLNTASGPPVFAILGDDSIQGDGIFTLSQSNGLVRAEKTLTNGLALIKEFRLATNYLVEVSVRFENRGQSPITLTPQDWVVGTATPMGPRDNTMAVMVLWHDGARVATVNPYWFSTNTTKLFFFPRVPTIQYEGGSNNVAWVSAQNQYFALATIPHKAAPEIRVNKVDLPPPSEEEINAAPGAILNPQGLQTELHYPGHTILAGQVFTTDFSMFAGPKEYQALSKLDARFNNEIDLVMNFGFFGIISKALLLSMKWLHGTLSLNYAIIIMLITVVIRAVFWPLTRASTRSMKRLQALQPQLKALQAKYKDDPQKFGAKQWEFYRKHKVSPLSGCWPMMLQIPVFFGLLSMLRSAIELRGASFLWIGDLSRADTVCVIPGLNFPVNPMPLIMGCTLLWQSSLQPPAPGMDPAQQKIMKFMPLMMLLFMYNLSSGLAVYWTVNNLLTVLQTKLTKTDPVLDAGKAPAPVPAAAPKKKN